MLNPSELSCWFCLIHSNFHSWCHWEIEKRWCYHIVGTPETLFNLSLQGKENVPVSKIIYLGTFYFLWSQAGKLLGWNIYHGLTPGRNCSSSSPFSLLHFSIVYSRRKKRKTTVKCQVLHLKLRRKTLLLARTDSEYEKS